MENKLANFVFSTKLGAYLLAAYLAIYFMAVFLVGIDNAGTEHLAQQRIEKLSQLSFEQLGRERVHGKASS